MGGASISAANCWAPVLACGYANFIKASEQAKLNLNGIIVCGRSAPTAGHETLVPHTTKIELERQQPSKLTRLTIFLQKCHVFHIFYIYYQIHTLSVLFWRSWVHSCEFQFEYTRTSSIPHPGTVHYWPHISSRWRWSADHDGCCDDLRAKSTFFFPHPVNRGQNKRRGAAVTKENLLNMFMCPLTVKSRVSGESNTLNLKIPPRVFTVV